MTTNLPPENNRSEEARLFHHGLELFNTGEWFEAHEVWEDAWHMASGPRKLFYQGLIQCAVTIEHIRRGNPRGVVTVYETAQTKFRGLPEVYMGVNVMRLLVDMRQFVQPVLDLPKERFSPELPRGQAMPVDLAKAPRIELESDPFGEA